MRKLILGVAALLSILWGCNNDNERLPEESKASVGAISRNTSSGLGIDNQILFLQSDNSELAGHLAITATVPEVTLIWNVSEECNLDTTQTTIPIVDGKATLDINWKHQQENENFAPMGTAFDSGVRISDGTTSIYVHLILTTDPVPEDFSYLLNLPSSETPMVNLIQITPSKIEMTKEQGSISSIKLSGTAPAQVETEEIGSFTKLDFSLIPDILEEDGDAIEIPFQWKSTAPESNFKVAYCIFSYDTSLKAKAFVAYSVQSDYFLTATPDTLQFIDAGGTLSSKIETNKDKWILMNSDSLPEWINYNMKEGGKGVSTLNLTTTANQSTFPRNCQLSLKADNLVTNIQVIQNGLIPELAVMPSSITNIKADGEKISVNITSNIDWNLGENIPSWLHPSMLQGSGNGAIVFTIDENNTFETRNATIEVYTVGNASVKREITFAQKPRVFDIAPSSFSDINLVGETVEVSVVSNVHWEVSETDLPTWLHPDISSGTGNGKIRFTIDANHQTSRRTASVKIFTTVDGTEVSKMVSFNQQGVVFDVSPALFENIKAEGEKLDVRVTSNVEWTIKDIPAWLHPNIKTGLGNQVISFTVDANDNFETRTGMVTFTATVGGYEYQKQITFTQESQDVILKVAQTDFKDISQYGKLMNTKVTSNVSWSAVSNNEWISVYPANGEGDAYLRFVIKGNNSSNSRKGSVTLRSTNPGTQVTITLTMEQKAR